MRRELLDALRQASGPSSVTDLGVRCEVSRSTASRHLDILRDAGLVVARTSPPAIHNELDRNAFTSIEDWHVGIRGGIYDPSELDDDRGVGFEIIRSEAFQDRSMQSIAEQVRDRLGTGPVYVSIDIDVLDPSQAPGTGTPEVAGITTREFFAVLRQLRGLDIVGGDVVEVAPAYDHAGITGLAAAHTAWELLMLIGLAE